MISGNKITTIGTHVRFGSLLIDHVVLPEGNRRDREADNDLIREADRVQALRRDTTAAGSPPDAERRRGGGHIDELKPSGLGKLIRRLNAAQNRDPVTGVHDEIECERDEEQPQAKAPVSAPKAERYPSSRAIPLRARRARSHSTNARPTRVRDQGNGSPRESSRGSPERPTTRTHSPAHTRSESDEPRVSGETPSVRPACVRLIFQSTRPQWPVIH